MRAHIYHPLPDGTDRTWTGAIQVYNHLLQDERERNRLRREVNTLDPHEPISVIIWHSCLPGRLRLSNLDSGETFERHIKACLQWEYDSLNYLRYYEPFSQGTTWNNDPTAQSPRRSHPAFIWLTRSPRQPLAFYRDSVSTQRLQLAEVRHLPIRQSSPPPLHISSPFKNSHHLKPRSSTPTHKPQDRTVGNAPDELGAYVGGSGSI